MKNTAIIKNRYLVKNRILVKTNKNKNLRVEN